MKASGIPVIAASALLLLVLSPVAGQEKGVFILPQDEQRVDDLDVAGTSIRGLQAGLSMMSVPGSDTPYYVIDEVDALRAHLNRALSLFYREDGDISVSFGPPLRSEFVHLLLARDEPLARYLRVDPAILFFAHEFFRSGGYAAGSRSMEFLEYLIPIAECSGLTAAVTAMQVGLEDSVSRIGMPPESRGTLFVDGLSYAVSVRMGLLTGRFGVSEGEAPRFDEVHTIMTTVRECSMGVEPQVRIVNF